MNAVNLLPEKHRPRKPTGGKGGSGYVLLGVLGAVLLGVVGYVFTLNSINESKSKTTEARVEAARLSDQANSLGPYGDFAKIKAERVASVKDLASQRFDYERLVLELAHVLPSDVWLTSASTSDGGGAATPGAPAAGAPAPGAAPAAGAGGPTLTLQGCARDQSQVAVTLVRLRQLQGASDVTLDHSTRGADSGSSAQATPAAAQGGSADSGCGTTGGKPNYAFQANVTFAPLTGESPDKVPNRLGGGA
jgi:Tfp pilus assembly protein PilN